MSVGAFLPCRHGNPVTAGTHPPTRGLRDLGPSPVRFGSIAISRLKYRARRARSTLMRQRPLPIRRDPQAVSVYEEEPAPRIGHGGGACERIHPGQGTARNGSSVKAPNNRVISSHISAAHCAVNKSVEYSTRQSHSSRSASIKRVKSHFAVPVL